MTQTELANSCVETLEILKYAPIEIKFKIPLRIKKKLKEKASSTYKWEYDRKKSLQEQVCSDGTKDILKYIFTYYISNKKEKNVEIINIRIKKYEELFKYKENKEENIHTDSAIIKKDSFIKKIINRIKLFFIK